MAWQSGQGLGEAWGESARILQPRQSYGPSPRHREAGPLELPEGLENRALLSLAAAGGSGQRGCWRPDVSRPWAQPASSD